MKNRIRELRKANHMSQIYLSIELEVAQETISAYENGKHYPSFQSLVKMSKLFNVPIDYIMGLSDSIGNNDLTAKENQIIRMFKALNSDNQDKVIAYTQGLLDYEK
ncbi:MAG: helix-turn-helix domain-containing protein [Clostridia bacterium]|nr:helix-turn-helix domain-containing protein [Clostridia bacterium]